MIKKAVLFLVVFYAAAHFCQKETDGFALSKISTELLDGNTPCTYPEQPFLYLGKGGQSYVFASEDGRYILKLFRSSRLNTLKFFLPWQKSKIQRLENELQSTLQSYLIAFNFLKEETGLVAVHLDRGPHAPLRIVDKLGIVHTLEKCPFIVQDRAVLVQDKISQWMEAGEVEKANRALVNLDQLVQHRIDLGIFDADPNLVKNFGFCGDRPIQIDGGRFSLSPLPCNTKLESSKQQLQNWIMEHYPELRGLNEAI